MRSPPPLIGSPADYHHRYHPPVEIAVTLGRLPSALPTLWTKVKTSKSPATWQSQRLILCLPPASSLICVKLDVDSNIATMIVEDKLRSYWVRQMLKQILLFGRSGNVCLDTPDLGVLNVFDSSNWAAELTRFVFRFDFFFFFPFSHWAASYNRSGLELYWPFCHTPCGHRMYCTTGYATLYIYVIMYNNICIHTCMYILNI